MMRHLLEGLPVFISESATSSGEAREYLRDNPETRLVLLDDGMQHLPLVRCVRAPVGGEGAVGYAEVAFAAVSTWMAAGGATQLTTVANQRTHQLNFYLCLIQGPGDCHGQLAVPLWQRPPAAAGHAA